MSDLKKAKPPAINFVAPMPPSDARSRLAALERDLLESWIRVRFFDMDDRTTRFKVYREAGKQLDYELEGYLREWDNGAHTHIVARFRPDGMRQRIGVYVSVYLVCTLILLIFSLTLQSILFWIGVGVIGAGIVWMTLRDYWQRKRDILRDVEQALEKSRGTTFDDPSAYFDEKALG